MGQQGRMEVLKVLLGQRGVYRQADYQMTTISQVRERPFISRDREMTTYMCRCASQAAYPILYSNIRDEETYIGPPEPNIPCLSSLSLFRAEGAVSFGGASDKRCKLQVALVAMFSAT